MATEQETMPSVVLYSTARGIYLHRYLKNAIKSIQSLSLSLFFLFQKSMVAYQDTLRLAMVSLAKLDIGGRSLKFWLMFVVVLDRRGFRRDRLCPLVRFDRSFSLQL